MAIGGGQVPPGRRFERCLYRLGPAVIIPAWLAVLNASIVTGLDDAALDKLAGDGLFERHIALCISAVTHRSQGRGVVAARLSHCGGFMLGGFTYLAFVVTVGVTGLRP